MKFYESHTNLTAELWTEYCANAVKTEPSAARLLANLGILSTKSEGPPDHVVRHMEAAYGHAMSATPLTNLVHGVPLTDDAVLHLSKFHKAGQLLHAVVGISTEIVEARRWSTWGELIKELGDLSWYSAIATCALLEPGESMESHFDNARSSASLEPGLPAVLERFEKAVGLSKKLAFYGRADLKTAVLQLLAEGLVLLDEFVSSSSGVSCAHMAELLAINSRKLLGARYASGSFSNEQAKERADVVDKTKDDDKA